jgi:hypothetical protein
MLPHLFSGHKGYAMGCSSCTAATPAALQQCNTMLLLVTGRHGGNPDDPHTVQPSRDAPGSKPQVHTAAATAAAYGCRSTCRHTGHSWRGTVRGHVSNDGGVSPRCGTPSRSGPQHTSMAGTDNTTPTPMLVTMHPVSHAPGGQCSTPINSGW